MSGCSATSAWRATGNKRESSPETASVVAQSPLLSKFIHTECRCSRKRLMILPPPPSQNGFIAREESQVFYSHTLSLVFLEYLVVRWSAEFVEDARQEEGGLYSVLCRLAGLYGVWCLHRHSALLYQGRYGA